MELVMYIMPRESISTAYFTNPPHQQYQHYSLSNFWGKTLIFILLERRTKHETWYVRHAARSHLNGALHKTIRSVIPTLQPFKLQRQNLDIA
jgi:hypothetical protein